MAALIKENQIFKKISTLRSVKILTHKNNISL